MHSKRQGLHLPRLQQVVLIDRREDGQARQGVGHARALEPVDRRRVNQFLRAVAVRGVRPSGPVSAAVIEARSSGPCAILPVRDATAFERSNEIDVVRPSPTEQHVRRRRNRAIVRGPDGYRPRGDGSPGTG